MAVEGDSINVNVEAEEPPSGVQLETSLHPDTAWRNDYYLFPLRTIAMQLGLDAKVTS